ncbi:glucan endo-1,3-beta-glucosidase-like [Curcuma longa]|uniref:glucan endo-1,3-beta-glucosidase-like n=1 Tax=Curcuma longa TaxID=136217 RepID=UPI003D9EE21E
MAPSSANAVDITIPTMDLPTKPPPRHHPPRCRLRHPPRRRIRRHPASGSSPPPPSSSSDASKQGSSPPSPSSASDASNQGSSPSPPSSSSNASNQGSSPSTPSSSSDASNQGSSTPPPSPSSASNASNRGSKLQTLSFSSDASDQGSSSPSPSSSSDTSNQGSPTPPSSSSDTSNRPSSATPPSSSSGNQGPPPPPSSDTSNQPASPNHPSSSTAKSTTGTDDETSSSSSTSIGFHARGSIGVTLGYDRETLPSPSTILQILKSHSITNLRLLVPIPDLIRALNGTGVGLMVGVPNDHIVQLSIGGVEACLHWIKSSALNYINADQVKYIAVGNEVLSTNIAIMNHLISCMYNFHQALQALKLDSSIKISSPFSSRILSVLLPPSAGTFSPFSLPVVRPILKFSSETGSPFMVNLSPFLRFLEDHQGIALNFFLFKANAATVTDGGLKYTNMFDVMIDALKAAMEKEGYSGIKVLVSGTGWPTTGNQVASPSNAAAFLEGVISRALQAKGTPKQPDQAVEVYLSNLFAGSGGGSNDIEKHSGIFNFDGSLAIDVDVKF